MTEQRGWSLGSTSSSAEQRRDHRPTMLVTNEQPEGPASLAVGERLTIECRSLPMVTGGHFWERWLWSWRSAPAGTLVLDEEGIYLEGHEPIRWEEPWLVLFEVWLLSSNYLELTVQVRAQGETPLGVTRELNFKVVLPQRSVSRKIHLKQSSGLGYISLGDMRRLWPVLCAQADLEGLDIRGALSLDQAPPRWDVSLKPPPRPKTRAGWWLRRKIDKALARWVEEGETLWGADTRHFCLFGDFDLGAQGSEGVAYIFSRLAALQHLSSLSIDSTIFDHMEDLEPLAQLGGLEDLSLRHVVAIRETRWNSVRHIDKPIRGLSSLSRLPRLTKLRVTCSMEDADELADLTCLTSLDLSGCGALTRIDGLSRLTNLTELNLSFCEALESIEPLASLSNLTSLDLSACKHLKSTDGLEGLTSLTSLDLGGCKSLTQVEGLEGLTSLTSLKLGSSGIERFNAPASLSKLTSLDLSGCKSLTRLDGLAHLSSLTSLDLGECEALVHLDDLASLTNLTWLSLYSCQSLENVDGLENLSKLAQLWCEGALSPGVRRVLPRGQFKGASLRALLASLRGES